MDDFILIREVSLEEFNDEEYIITSQTYVSTTTGVTYRRFRRWAYSYNMTFTISEDFLLGHLSESSLAHGIQRGVFSFIIAMVTFDHQEEKYQFTQQSWNYSSVVDVGYRITDNGKVRIPGEYGANTHI